MFKKLFLIAVLQFFLIVPASSQSQSFKNGITSDVLKIVSSVKYNEITDTVKKDMKRKLNKYFSEWYRLDILETYHIEIGNIDDILGIEIMYRFVTDDTLTYIAFTQRGT